MKYLLSLIFAFSAFFVCADEFRELYKNPDIPLAQGLEVPVPEDVFRTGNPVEIRVWVNNATCGWMVHESSGGTPLVFLTDGKSRWFPRPFHAEGQTHSGRIAPGGELCLKFDSIPEVDVTPLKLVFSSGIYSWEAPRGTFALEVYVGEKLRLRATTDPRNRVCRFYASDLRDVTYYEWQLPDGQVIQTAEPYLKQRFPVLTEGENSFGVSVTAYLTEGGRQTATARVTRGVTTLTNIPTNEMLVGMCFYPSVPDEAGDSDGIRKVRENMVVWGAPRLAKPYWCSEYVDDFRSSTCGNLAVFWPLAPGVGKSGENCDYETVQQLADAGCYSMTIYKRESPGEIAKLTEAGHSKFFLNNNIGEFASYLYQGSESARACGVLESKNLRECRDFFVDHYMLRGCESYHTTYPYIFSTCGATLANYELEGGVDFACSELYAVGAQNLAWATAEMRGAARKWKPEFWGGWLAHEWQTCDIPYLADQKMGLLRAGLYQQFLMGTSVIVLESGSQTTQAGHYTAESGDRNFAFDEEPCVRYRREMRDFYAFVKREMKPVGETPETKIALALGNLDGYVGMFSPHLPVWAQHASAKQDSRWFYGNPERSVLVLQQLFFPCPKDAIAPYMNRFLAGSPLGQVDVTGVDDLTRLDDLTRYKLIVYAGWNTMTPSIFRLLCEYVNQGGTLVMAVPHFSTRTDREAVDYTPGDLFQGGNLAPLMDVQITGRESIHGEWMARHESSKSLIQKDFGMIRTLEQARGQGKVVLLLNWEYPGKASLAADFQNIVREQAEQVPNDVTLEADEGTRPYLCWAIYPGRVYVQNIDCNQTRKCVVCIGKQRFPLEIPPTLLKRVEFPSN